jgi:hypothetical protein
MFAKDLSNKIFLPPRRQDTKFNYNKHLFLCLGAFVAIPSGLSGLGYSKIKVGPTNLARHTQGV